MTDRLIRLMRLITLIQGKPGILARELADRCEAVERTIYRDLEALSAMQIPITNMGYGKGYMFAGNFSIYPLNWTEEETLAFSMLPSVIDQMKHLLPSGFERAYEKVMATNSKEKARRAEVAQQITEIIQMGTPVFSEDQAHFLTPIIQASLSQNTIQAQYYTQSRNELSQRLIDPYYLVPRDHRFYLIGHCHTAGKARTFRISRFREVEIMPQSFRKDSFNLNAYLKHTWSIERGEQQLKFIVKFTANIARYIKEEELFVKPKLTDFPDGSLLFEVTLNNDREFLGWLAQYGPDAVIIEPKSYRERMRDRLMEWAKVYSE